MIDETQTIATGTREALRDEVKRVLSHSLGSNILPARGDGPSWKVDWPWMLLLSMAVALSFYLYGRSSTLRPLCWLNLWTVGFLFVAMPVAYWVKKKIVQVLYEEVFSGMTDESLAAATRRLRDDYRPATLWKTSALTSGGWGIFAGTALLFDLLKKIDGPVWGPFSLWLFCSLAFITAAKVGANCTFYDAIAAACRPADLESFPYAAAESPIVHGMVLVGKGLVGFMAFSALYLVILLAWVHYFEKFVLVSLTIFLLGSLGLGVTVYSRVTTRLAELVSRRRQCTLRELQARLRESAESNRDEFASAHDLFTLVLSQRPNLGIPAAVRGAWPLLIQLATLVVAIWEVNKPS